MKLKIKGFRNIFKARGAEDAGMTEQEIELNRAKKALKVSRRKERIAFVVGAVTIFFSVVGLIFSISFTAETISNIANQTSRKTKYENLILPLVILDPAAFPNPKSVMSNEGSFIVESALWNIVINGDLSKYSVDDMGSILIPSADVEASLVSLYGGTFGVEHKNIGDAIYMIEYDSQMRMYIMPTYGMSSAYTPRVYKIESVGEHLELTVGYIPLTLPWATEEQKKQHEQNPDKFKVYVIKEEGKKTYIVSVNDLSAKEQEDLHAIYDKKKTPIA